MDKYRSFEDFIISKQRKWPCKRTIVFEDTLLSWDNDFMNKQKIDWECLCEDKALCKQVVDLLDHKKIELAKALLDNNKDGYKSW